jgi:hypothetical protein
VAIILSDRVVIAGLQLHRFEAITILSLVALLLALIRTAGGGKVGALKARNPSSTIHHPSSKIAPWLLVSFFAAFLAACTHPFGMAIGGGLVGMAGIDWLILRRRSAAAALVPAAGFLLGLGSVALYFYLIPEARAQFLANLALQNTFNAGSRFGFFTTHLRYYHWVGFPLWGLAILAIPYAFWKLVRRRHPDSVFSAWALPLAALAVPALFFLTRSANNSYAALGTPFVAILLAAAVGLIPRKEHPLLRTVAVLLLCLLALGFLSVYPYRWLLFFKSGRPNFPREMSEIVDKIPAGVRVYIPPPMWDAARTDRRHEFRLWSLSVAAPWKVRLAFEKGVYSEARKGDFLIVDLLSAKSQDPWGIVPTFERYPPDPRYWEPVDYRKKMFPGSGNDFGYELGIYRFLGGLWDPEESPRAIPGR